MGSHANSVLFLTDVKGLKLDGRVVERLSMEEARSAMPEIGFGMQKKILAGIEALEGGVKEVIIASGFGQSPIASAMSHEGCTVITS
jgi:acetylglutamate/LysW-gamma-L-alpha-aminoadipate kinase